MAITFAGGNQFEGVGTIPVTTSVNIARKSFVNMDGSLPSSAAVCTGGVARFDAPSGLSADVFLPGNIVEVWATGAVTAGLLVEILQGTVYSNISGTSTSVTAAGVQNIASGYVVGRALDTTDAGGTVRVYIMGLSTKPV